MEYIKKQVKYYIESEYGNYAIDTFTKEQVSVLMSGFLNYIMILQDKCSCDDRCSDVKINGNYHCSKCFKLLPF